MKTNFDNSIKKLRLAGRLRFATVIGAIGMASLFAPTANATVTINYSGPTFVNFSALPNVFDNTMNITGTIILAAPLAPNMTVISNNAGVNNVGALSWSFTTGAGTITNTSPSLQVASFQIGTDASGNIINWRIGIGINGFLYDNLFTGGCTPGNCSSIQVGDYAGHLADTANSVSGGGSLVATPEPGTLLLSAVAIGGLSLLRRKSS